MFQKIHESKPPTVGFIASGKLTDLDYQSVFMPEVEDAIDKHGKINLLWRMEEFEGWEMHAAWDELLLSLRTRDSIKRIALVGEEKWQEKLPRYLKPITHAEVRYYDKQQLNEAQDWISQQPSQ